MNDPILHVLGIKLYRAFLFCACSILIALAIWFFVLMKCIGVKFDELPRWAAEAWPPVSSMAAAALFWQPIAIGILTMTVTYLVIGRWWKKRGDVHSRGARLSEGDM